MSLLGNSLSVLVVMRRRLERTSRDTRREEREEEEVEKLGQVFSSFFSPSEASLARSLLVFVALVFARHSPIAHRPPPTARVPSFRRSGPPTQPPLTPCSPPSERAERKRKQLDETSGESEMTLLARRSTVTIALATPAPRQPAKTPLRISPVTLAVEGPGSGMSLVEDGCETALVSCRTEEERKERRAPRKKKKNSAHSREVSIKKPRPTHETPPMKKKP